MLNGRMMDMPLLISSIIDYAADVRSSSEIVSQTVEGIIHRYTYADSHSRASQLANALKKLGLKAPMVGHLGDGNFHIMMPYDPKVKDQYDKIKNKLPKNVIPAHDGLTVLI